MCAKTILPENIDYHMVTVSQRSACFSKAIVLRKQSLLLYQEERPIPTVAFYFVLWYQVLVGGCSIKQLIGLRRIKRVLRSVQIVKQWVRRLACTQLIIQWTMRIYCWWLVVVQRNMENKIRLSVLLYCLDNNKDKGIPRPIIKCEVGREGAVRVSLPSI